MEAGPVSAVVGRFAPSPSGRLHLGNLACSLLAWLSARSLGGRIVLRIEDLDAERCPRKYADQLEEDLGWLGLFWDEGGSKGGPHEPYYQSECSGIYTESYKKLEAMGLVYPCFCSRSQLHAASAPHTSDGNVIYPGTCRGLTAEEIAEKRKKKAPAYRLMVLPAPKFAHCPLLLASDGRRLSKRDGDQSLENLRARYTAEDIVGRLAYAYGLQEEPAPRTPESLIKDFSWDKVPKKDICLPEGLFE